MSTAGEGKPIANCQTQMQIYANHNAMSTIHIMQHSLLLFYLLQMCAIPAHIK